MSNYTKHNSIAHRCVSGVSILPDVCRKNPLCTVSLPFPLQRSGAWVTERPDGNSSRAASGGDGGSSTAVEETAEGDMASGGLVMCLGLEARLLLAEDLLSSSMVKLVFGEGSLCS